MLRSIGGRSLFVSTYFAIASCFTFVSVEALILPFSCEPSVAYIRPGKRGMPIRPASVPAQYIPSTPSVPLCGTSLAVLEFRSASRSSSRFCGMQCLLMVHTCTFLSYVASSFSPVSHHCLFLKDLPFVVMAMTESLTERGIAPRFGLPARASTTQSLVVWSVGRMMA